MDRKLQRHRADSLRQHGFLVNIALGSWAVGDVFVTAVVVVSDVAQ